MLVNTLSTIDSRTAFEVIDGRKHFLVIKPATGAVFCTGCNVKVSAFCRHAAAVNNRLAAPNATTKAERILARLAATYGKA